MATTVMSLKTDKTIKKKAQKLANKMGFRLGTLINGYLRHFLKTKEVHFVAEKREKLRPEVVAELKEIIEDVKKGKNMSPTFDNIDDAIEFLEKGDEDQFS